MSLNRETIQDKKRIVIKIGSSSLTHESTGSLNLSKMEKLVRILTDLRNQFYLLRLPSQKIHQGPADHQGRTKLLQAIQALWQHDR